MTLGSNQPVTEMSILCLKCDGTRAETRFRLSAKRTSPFKSVGASVQSITGSRAVRISGSNAGYTMFRGNVKSTGYPTPFASIFFTSPPMRHRVPSHFNWTLPIERQPVSRANNLTNFTCRLVEILEGSTSWSPEFLSRQISGQL